MNSNLKVDEFFVKLSERDRDRRWSLVGLQFFSEFITKAVELAGLNPAQVIIRAGDERNYNYDTVTLAWPTSSTSLITDLTFIYTDGPYVIGKKRKPPCRGSRFGVGERYSKWSELDKAAKFQLHMADPDVYSKLAEIIKSSLPKNSKFVEKP